MGCPQISFREIRIDIKLIINLWIRAAMTFIQVDLFDKNHYSIIMITHINTIDKTKVSLFGSKAAFQGELAIHDIPVPEGYVLSVNVFHQFLEHNNINADPGCFLACNDVIQQQILTGTFPPEQVNILTAIFSFLHTEEGGLVVRSSALCEDTGKTSFAGVFETFPDIHSVDNMIHAIKKCYASLIADTSLAYALANNIPFQELQMGIIIQTFVRGRPSGVLFTADTVSMNPDVMIINWVDDVCAACVHGTAQSRQLRINRKEKIPHNTEGLSGTQIASLAALGNICEKYLGYFQDIEWTFSGQTLYVLQSRPITTFKEKEFPVTWKNDKDKEYTWRKEYGPVFPLDQEQNCARLEAENKGALGSGIEYFYYARMIQNSYQYIRKVDMPGAEQKQEEYNRYISKLKEQGKNIFTDIYLPRILEIHKKMDNYMHRDLSDTELAAFLDASFDAMDQISGMHWLVVQGCLYDNALKEFREDYGFKSYETILLLHQETWLTKYADRILRMVQLVKKEPVLHRLFLKHTCQEVIYAHLTDKNNSSIAGEPAVISLISLMNAFLNDFGLYAFAWNDNRIHRERPWMITGYIRQMLDRDVDEYFTNKQQQEKQQKEFIDSLPSRLGEEKWMQLKSVLPYHRKSYLVRDNHSHYIDATEGGFYQMACILTGARLVQQKKIEAAEDIVFLYREEIKQALSGNLPDTARLIAERKHQHEYNSTLLAPPVLGKKPEPYEEEPEKPGDSSAKTVLKGFSGLAAVVKGEVRFKKDIPDITRGQYIFVFLHVREIDFNTILPYAAGLVFRWGTPFEHVGIWARENNIPTLFGVDDVTELLKTGDVVELDGLREELRIIGRGKRRDG